MSELAPGSLSLDETYESQVAEEGPPEPQPPAETPPAVPDDPEPEGTVEIPTGKVVPLGALQSERAAKREADARAQKAEQEAAEAKQKLDVIQREWTQIQPLIQQLKTQPPAQQAPAPVAKGPLSDHEAMEYARDLDLYKADGTPDVDRAQRLAARQAAISEKQAQAAVLPLQQLTDQQRSAYYFNHYANLKDKAGQPVVDPQILRETWAVAPPSMAASPEIAQTLFMNAVGRSVLEGKYRGFAQQTVPPPPPVAHTESLGGGVPGKTEPSAFEKRAMEAANLGQKEFMEIASRFKPGERNSLE